MRYEINYDAKIQNPMDLFYNLKEKGFSHYLHNVNNGVIGTESDELINKIESIVGVSFVKLDSFN